MKVQRLLTELGVEKVCVSCREPWPADPEFYHRHPGTRDGLTNECRACACERGAAYRSGRAA